MTNQEIQIVDVDYHRNGVCGAPFHVVLFREPTVMPPYNAGVAALFVATVFEQPGVVSVLCVDRLAMNDVAFRSNSWRGDVYEPALRRAVKEHEDRERAALGYPNDNPAADGVRAARADARAEAAADPKAHRPATCGICRATVIVWKRKGVPARTLRLLALADHVRETHPVVEPEPEVEQRDPLCCDYKTCRHSCTDDDPCAACVGRGDCGEGLQGSPHAKDADCDVDPDTDTCRECGVVHGDPCRRCGGRGFHVSGCEDSDDFEQPAPVVDPTDRPRE